ncbi:MAG: NDP-hexose 2,3-dehydratase family protein [Pleurocapsa sp.]
MSVKQDEKSQEFYPSIKCKYFQKYIMKKSVRIAQSVHDLENFAELVRNQSKFQLKPIKLSDQNDWIVKDDCLSHKSGGFFSLCGYRDQQHDFEALVLFQPQGAFNGMAIHCRDDRVYLLLQARVEPGNSRLVQYGPTIQSTPANYLRLHGGKKTAYLEFFFEYRAGVKVLENSTQLDLGKRYYQKTKLLSYIQLEEMCQCEENTIWAPLDIVARVIDHDNFLNTDLRSMIGVFDWDSLFDKSLINNFSSNLTLPVKRQSKNSGGLISLAALRKWKLTDEGIEPKANVATSAKLYQVICTNREVGQWIQPLFLCNGIGLVLLYQRLKNGKKEFLLQKGREFGVSGNTVYLPSEVVYPDENKQISLPEGEVLIDLLQSEEGGRFLKNENRYQLVQVDEAFALGDEHIWVSIPELKTLLSTSNMVSIQLRCIASLLLPTLNPLVGSVAKQVAVV